MKTLQPITTPVAELHPDTRRSCALVTIRAMRGYLTGAEAHELQQLHRRMDERARVADLAHDKATESHAFACTANPHCD